LLPSAPARVREPAPTSGEHPDERGDDITTTHEIQPGSRIDLTPDVVGFGGAGAQARLVEQVPGRPPRRIDGYTIGAPHLTFDPPPHGGEMHPDGDELLYLVSGAATVTLELPDGTTDVDLAAGDALVIPQGTWHQVTTIEAGQLLHITPGPNGEARPPKA
jgi:mannose-6-phosphate isomerase-like protein (cupin superfamily)